MSCDEIGDLLPLYALEILESEERSEVESHLSRDCEVCAQSLQDALALNATVLATVPAVEPPRGLRDKVVNLAAPRPRSAARYAWPGIAAGLAIAALFLGIAHQRRSAELARAVDDRTISERQAQVANAALSFLLHPETRPASMNPDEKQPRGRYYVNPGGVLLIASNLPAAGPGKAYQMWMIPKTAGPVPAGVFQPDVTGGAVHLQTTPVDLATVKALAITVEPESGSPAPTTTPILVSPVAE